jgi:amino acid adenylation domain-containing protein
MITLLQQAISDRAHSRPEYVAVCANGELTSYGELELESNRIAYALRDIGVERGDRVALLMPKSPAAIASMLGALKADATYVPLDCSNPPIRLIQILELLRCKCIIASGPTGSLLREVRARLRLVPSPKIIWLDPAQPWDDEHKPSFTQSDIRELPSAPVATSNRSDDLAHILFTSGSTGVPKGVTITHGNILAFLRWAWAYFGINSSDRVSQHAPLFFDLSTFDIFGALGAGAQVHLIPPELNLLPHKLAEHIRESQLTQWLSAPSVLTLLSKYQLVRNGDFQSLRRVMWCGETIPTPTLIDWMRRLPHVRFTNLYGPTETTIASSYYTVPTCPTNERDPIPIGTACEREHLAVLDDSLRPVPDNEIGEIYIAGEGLSPGYWRDPDATRRAFLPRPGAGGPSDRIYRTGDLATRNSEGVIYFIGRKDTQIKSRGYRIELGEIETALNALPRLRESAVLGLQTNGFEQWIICCAYVPTAGCEGVHPVALRQILARTLPSYMLPVRWLSCSSLPRNASGKVDRNGLRRLFTDGGALLSDSSHLPAATHKRIGLEG